ncbi:hypothetical protein CEP52_007861 [Fusarium oligoseptatum]|uniref:Major facilitator superfamily transporter n=1 Tax=Fusarium oligoseptatum TaxID=2604345 RepID=A0A428TKL8_9HYPO|nr:hypothetical protein CEP52_007861 [Fusarium oligoseptatum]
MAQPPSPTSSSSNIEPENGLVQPYGEKAVGAVVEASDDSSSDGRQPVPLSWKIASVVLVTAIGFGSQWSSGITAAMKSTIKKEMGITNTQFSLLEASEDFMVTALMMVSGIVTDRIGGAGAMLYGNLIYSVGSILVAGAAQTRSYKFMIAGRVVRALGDIATQIAQYKVFSSWFAPGNGFGSTLGFELGVGKMGAFAGKSSANIIAKKTGDFAWVFWVAVFMNIFTNVMTVVFLLVHQGGKQKVPRHQRSGDCGLELTLLRRDGIARSCSMLASSLFLYWVSSLTFTDTEFRSWSFCGLGVFTSMLLVNFSGAVKGTAASFGVFAFAYCFGPTTIIDSTRTSMWDSTVFGSAYSIKITLNNAMNIIVRVITGRIQDADNNSYDRVTIVYVVLAGCSVVVSLILGIVAWRSVDLGHLQWTRKMRIAQGHILNSRKQRFYEENGSRNKKISLFLFLFPYSF